MMVPGIVVVVVGTLDVVVVVVSTLEVVVVVVLDD